MIIIKAGGGKTIDWDFIVDDLKKLQKKEKIILVHGASVKRDEIAKKLGFPTKIVTSPSGVESVYTDEYALDIFLMVYSGLVNKKTVALLQHKGINAVGLSGIDGKLWQAKAKKELLIKEGVKTKLIQNNKTGRVEKVNTSLIRLLLDNHYLPVISAPAISFENEIVNCDNDWATAVMAGELGVKKLVFLFEAPGLLQDLGNESSLIRHIPKRSIEDFAVYAQGRMRKKIIAAKKAFAEGVKTIYWGDGRIRNPIINCLEGKGTVFN